MYTIETDRQTELCALRGEWKEERERGRGEGPEGEVRKEVEREGDGREKEREILREITECVQKYTLIEFSKHIRCTYKKYVCTIIQ